ncbi:MULTISPECIES: LysR family transcriptional regulator [Pantoea]|jgi:LysR family transcriptional regulator of abg operon|uniref:LysR family transcriptional regulator n=2 Tax=Pantoea TaxID=53335 RepID=A0AAU7TWY3_9GAMM|nr:MULTISPECIES: LysR family transcriptional regulator [Pantoea]MBY4953220.1 LysR family transcriptional regulator [Pantoea sp. DY-17]MDR6352047.1 LysR family transcriptional regulator of abg operon [Pantoea sp. SORGH_AS_0659]PLR24842.1 LysR family transcriptional regulator [Pantoea endophytica]QCP58202.1 LysR family transcriptional regulator [Pantoea sp. SO10]WFL67868.1 LysR family transcriptional regulator [Pantoea sp. X85]
MSANLKLHQLRAFVAVARQGSIRAASRLSGLSQPALTKAIQELELALGARLFERRQQGVTLTDIGDNFFKHASLVLEELRVAQEDIQQRLGLAGGRVNIGVGGSIARTVMPQVINQFHREYPLVKVRIVEGQLVSMVHELRQGELDFTINTYDKNHLDQELVFERLMERDYQVVMRKGHPMAHARTLAELQHCDWTMPTPQGSYYRLLHDLFGERGMAPKIVVTCETFMACTSLVAQSDFVSIISRDVIEDPTHGGQLISLVLDEPLPKATFYLIQRKDTALTPMSAYMAQLFRRYCQQR